VLGYWVHGSTIGACFAVVLMRSSSDLTCLYFGSKFYGF